MDNTFDSLYYSKGKFIGGIDESGVGDIAGPLVAACVVLPIIDPQRDDLRIFDVNDCKQVPPGPRKRLVEVIINTALGIGIGEVSASEIDYFGKINATRLAMTRAVYACKKASSGKVVQPDFLLIDGKFHLDIETPQQSIVSGDCKSLCVAAASIIAKVWRDDLMNELHKKFPMYGWDSNKGWPCPAHFDGLDNHGIQIGIHRIKGWPFSPSAQYKENKKDWIARQKKWNKLTLKRLEGVSGGQL